MIIDIDSDLTCIHWHRSDNHRVKTFLYAAYWITNLLLIFEKIVFWPF